MLSRHADVSTPEEYLAALDEPRRTDIATLHDRIRSVAPGLTSGTQRGFLTYGGYHYKYGSGREGDWFALGLASNKQYISLYAPPNVDLEGYVARLPKANLGRGCIRFKRVADVDLEVVDEIVRKAAEADGKTLRGREWHAPR